MAFAKRAADLEERIEHSLQIESRAADNLEHVGSGGLLLQGLAQLTGALLLCLEQPHVLNGDHRLVCEAFHQFDLFVSELLNFGLQNGMTPRRVPSRSIGTASTVR